MIRFLRLMSVIVLFLTACAGSRPLRPTDIDVPDGFRVEVAVEDLAAPTMVAFDDQGRMLIAESAYGGGGEPKVTRIESNGKRRFLRKAVFLELSCRSHPLPFMMGRYMSSTQGRFPSLMKADSFEISSQTCQVRGIIKPINWFSKTMLCT
ncbi:MAG TPA: hypothetical protein VFY66_04155 [Anaerolineales bacterium]|nr:hypothetical protein [Anaerolineales bacterium]